MVAADGYQAPKRIATPHGEVIRFPLKTYAGKPRAPEFSRDHPGVAFMRAWSGEVMGGVGAPGRFRVSGQWFDQRPSAAEVHGDDEAEA